MAHVVDEIIEALDGPTAIHRATGYPVQTVHSWTVEPKNIPVWRRAELLALAQRREKLADLSPECLSYLQSHERQADAA